MIKYVAGIQYVGSAYSGWQTQQHVLTVQQVVEEALSNIANEQVAVHCAGRTDTGVHAFEQVIHFESSAIRSDYAWRMGCNSKLPDDVRIMWCHQINDDFHARFSAIARQYRYVIYNAQAEGSLLKGRVNWLPYELNEKYMNKSAQSLLGENDFTSFRASGCQSTSPNRNVHQISVTRVKDFVFVDIEANAFLHHMVRNIVGSLIDVGRSRKPVDWMSDLLALRNRNSAGMTAAANGLYFVKAIYPEQYSLKQMKHGDCVLFK